ncbi:Wzz/FepE/Etk N-terminal domain-containing protein [Clostridiaceae bacterium 35-E11]
MKEVEVKEYFFILRKKARIIFLMTILSVTVSGIFSLFILKPTYQTFTTLMVGKLKGDERTIEYNDILLNQKLVMTYGEIAKSRVVSNEVIKNLGLDMTHKDLSKKVEVKLVSDTQIFKIEVTDKDPEFAAALTNGIAQVFIEYIGEIMDIQNIQVIDQAEVAIEPVKPVPILNMTIAGGLGMMVSVFGVLFLNYMDDTLKTPEDITQYLDLSVIGTIPKISPKR